VPPEHTVPVGFKPYKYGANFEMANKENKNPLAGDESVGALMVGQKHYETNCMACHGMTGKGDGPVGTKMSVKPPPLISDKIKGWNDGGIYHVITMGQGTMGPYASHIPQASRWQVVNYIRQLQKNSKEAAQ
jgi:mono/diheme cytochrome c family protein